MLVLQYITNFILAMAGISISVLAFGVNYRNNMGWKPLTIITKWRRDIVDGNWNGSLTFELWNRQKYPINVREIFLEVKDAKFLYGQERRGTWLRSDNTMWQEDGNTIAPTTFEKIEMPLMLQTTKQEVPYTLTINYFDPRFEKVLKIQRKGKLV